MHLKPVQDCTCSQYRFAPTGPTPNAGPLLLFCELLFFYRDEHYMPISWPGGQAIAIPAIRAAWITRRRRRHGSV